MNRSLVLPAVLAVHLAVAAVHGTTHAAVPVWLDPWANVAVLLTTFLGPIAGVALDHRDHPLGVPLFTVSMAGALALGVTLHFLVENPDHVSRIPGGTWGMSFQVSALAAAVTPAVGTLVGGWYWRDR